MPYKKYECIICGYIYDEELGDPDDGLAPGTRWEDIPVWENKKYASKPVLCDSDGPIAKFRKHFATFYADADTDADADADDSESIKTANINK